MFDVTAIHQIWGYTLIFGVVGLTLGLSAVLGISKLAGVRPNERTIRKLPDILVAAVGGLSIIMLASQLGAAQGERYVELTSQTFMELHHIPFTPPPPGTSVCRKYGRSSYLSAAETAGMQATADDLCRWIQDFAKSNDVADREDWPKLNYPALPDGEVFTREGFLGAFPVPEATLILDVTANYEMRHNAYEALKREIDLSWWLQFLLAPFSAGLAAGAAVGRIAWARSFTY